MYLHFPFCRRRCIYCDFNTYAGSKLIERERYKNALLVDIRSNNFARVSTVYFGGGTPTFLSSSWLAEILGCVRQNFSLDDGCEITVEANPGTLSLQDLERLCEAGFNRLSMGVQSLDPELLKRLGRIHRRQEVFQSVEWAKRAGFKNINLDLIYGLPGQSLISWQKTVRGVLSLEPQHISCYALTVEEGTPLFDGLDKGLWSLPAEDEVIKMEHWLNANLRKCGYEHYEISNWCKPGYSCRHNLTYWKNSPYLGLGAGAVSYINGWRYGRIKGYLDYCQAVENGASLYDWAERLSLDGRWREDLILGLRRKTGVNVKRWLKRVPGQFRDNLRETFKILIESIPRELYHFDGSRLRLSRRGRELSNEVFVRILE
ncbi:radical SAM family heme chaperone HemW [bacterium]|nr:radical SAM family heme chaperone HemW [bacterium]